MARVRSIPSSELPSDLADVYERFASGYGPFRNQVAVFAHVPAALRHLMPMLMELREAKTLPKRYLEIAIVVVSKLNECHYCVAHHKPFLAVEGLSPRAIDHILDPANPELEEVDRDEVVLRITATPDHAGDGAKLAEEVLAVARGGGGSNGNGRPQG